MGQRCGNCYGTGIWENKRCHCQGPAKRWFPPKAKKKAEGYAFKSGHKHDPDKFLHETKSGMWFECGCGETFKIEA